MILYHGSNVRIEKIDLSLGQLDKDFGRGFYLTDIKQQAEDMAARRCRITGQGKPTITTFEFDERWLNTGELKVLKFDKPDEPWARFILANRKASRTGFTHDYDIVIGPVADDGVVFQLNRYIRGLIDMDRLIKELTYKDLNRQYFFGTERAIDKLTKL